MALSAVVMPADAAPAADAIAAPTRTLADAAPGSAGFAAPAGPTPLPPSPPPTDAALATDAAGSAPLPRPAAPGRPARPDVVPPPSSTNVMLAPTLNPRGPVTVYRSRNYGATGQIVAFVVPPQPAARGPEHLTSSGVVQPSKLTVSARDRATGATRTLTLRGFQPTTCGNNQMNSAALCDDGKRESVLALTLFPADNAGAPPGVYTGRFAIEARRARARSGSGDSAGSPDRSDGTLVEILTFDYAISIEPDARAPAADQ